MYTPHWNLKNIIYLFSSIKSYKYLWIKNKKKKKSLTIKKKYPICFTFLNDNPYA